MSQNVYASRGEWDDDEFEKAVQQEMKRLEEEMFRQMKLANMDLVDENVSTTASYQQEELIPSSDDSFKKSNLSVNTISSKDSRRKAILEQRILLEAQIEESKQRKASERQRELEEDRMRLRNFQQSVVKPAVDRGDGQSVLPTAEPFTSDSGKYRTQARAQMMRDVYGTMGDLLRSHVAQSSIHSPKNITLANSLSPVTTDRGASLSVYPELYKSTEAYDHSSNSSNKVISTDTSTTAWKPSNLLRGASDSVTTKQAQRAALDAQVAEARRRKEAEKLRDRYDDERRLLQEAEETARVAEEKQRLRDELRQQEAEDLKLKQSRSEIEALRRRGKLHAVKNTAPAPLLLSTSQHLSHRYDGEDGSEEPQVDGMTQLFAHSSHLPSIHEGAFDGEVADADTEEDGEDGNIYGDAKGKGRETEAEDFSPLVIRVDGPENIVLTKDDIKKFQLLRRLLVSDNPSLLADDESREPPEPPRRVESRLLPANEYAWNHIEPSSHSNNQQTGPGYGNYHEPHRTSQYQYHSSLPETNYEKSMMSESLLLFVPMSAKSGKSIPPQPERQRHDRHQQNSRGVLQSLNSALPPIQSTYESRLLPIRAQSNEPEMLIVPNSFSRGESAKGRSAPSYSSSAKLRPSTAAVNSALPGSRPITPAPSPSSSLTQLPPLRPTTTSRPSSSSTAASSVYPSAQTSVRSLSLPPIRPSSGLLRPSSSAIASRLPESRPVSAVSTNPTSTHSDLFTEIERSTQSASLRQILDDIKVLEAQSVEKCH